MTFEQRRKIEKRIAKKAIADLLAAGFELSVHDGGELVVTRSRSPGLILSGMFSTDDDRLIAYRPGEARAFGWVLFVYGNDGYDVISDSTVNLEPFLAGVNALADSLDR